MTADSLAKGQQTAVIANIKQVMGPAFEAALAKRLERHLTEKGGTQLAPGRGEALAKLLSEGALAALASGLPGAAPKLAQAAKDPAPGITLTFEFRFADKNALASGTPGSPTMTIRGGRHRD